MSYVIAGHYTVRYNVRPIYEFNVWGTVLYLYESDKYAGITKDANGQDIIEKPVKIAYQVKDYIGVTVQSLEMKIRKDGSVVRTLTDLQTGERNEILWDGKDELGNTVAPGEYTIQIEATANGLKTTSRMHKVTVYAVKLCKRDLMGISPTEKIILEYLIEVHGQLYHNFIWIKGKTFGFTTSDANITARCGIEGPGLVEPNLAVDIGAATSGSMNGSCRIFTCNNPDKLLQHIRDQVPSTSYYYCLSYDPLNNETGGINCQDWANKMLATYCD